MRHARTVRRWFSARQFAPRTAVALARRERRCARPLRGAGPCGRAAGATPVPMRDYPMPDHSAPNDCFVLVTFGTESFGAERSCLPPAPRWDPPRLWRGEASTPQAEIR